MIKKIRPHRADKRGPVVPQALPDPHPVLAPASTLSDWAWGVGGVLEALVLIFCQNQAR